jgi:protease PrsW
VSIYTVFEFVIAFLPILIFLACLMLFDSYKLVKLRSLIIVIFLGMLTAFGAIILNYHLLGWLEISIRTYSRFLAPITEEVLKILFIVYLIKAKRIGFMVDAAIFGFAVGTGFAIIENIYYMRVLTDAGLLTWFVRGFGTAVMHGGTTAIAAIITKDLSDRKNMPLILTVLPGLIAAILIHSLFNQFILPPVTTTLVILITLPPVVYLVFKKSEQNTRRWLGTGLDSDMEMLKLLMAGNISESRIGNYLRSIQDSFSAQIVGDMICYLRIYLELSVKAKGVLIMKENGFDMPPDPEIKAQFDELSYLEKTLGKTGKLAIQPLLNISDTDLWQLHMLQQDITK